MSEYVDPKSHGAKFVHGNELSVIEKRVDKLRWVQPLFVTERVDYEPHRPTYDMLRLRSEETLAYGRRKMTEVRKLKHEFTDKIKEMEARKKREEAERQGGGMKQRHRWWHRKTAVELRDPLKMLRFNNLTFKPEELMSTKDIVILQLTGCKLGDAGMSWVSAFMQASYSLKRICLQANKIGVEGAKELFLGLRTTKTLMEFDISMNPIGDDGCAVLCNALSENARWSRVYTVNMSCCKLGPSAAYHLARLIRDFKPLQSLLLWRNNLGCMTPMKIGGVASILEELRSTSNLKLLNLSCNVISDADASSHANAREIELRRRSMLEMERKLHQNRVDELQKEIRIKRREAVWDDQRVQIATMEKELEQERSRLRVAASLEAKSRTAAQRAEMDYQARVKNALNADLIVNKVKPRLILTGNFSIRRTTLLRLAKFYDLDTIPNATEFVERRRRFDNVVASRRQLGEPYEGPRDIDAYDTFNVFTTDTTFDPDADHARRTVMLNWREEQRLAAMNAQAVKFEKYSFKKPTDAPKPGAKLVAGGFKVASGVNDNIRDERAADRLPKKAEDPKIRTEEATTANVKKKIIIEQESEVEIVRRKADGTETVQRSASNMALKDKEQQQVVGATAIEELKKKGAAPPAAKASKPVVDELSDSSSDEDLPPPKRGPKDAEWGTEGGDYERLLPARRESVMETADVEGFDLDADMGDHEESEDLLSVLQQVDESETIQQKLQQRMAEHKAKLQSKTQSTPRNVESSVAVVAQSSSNVDVLSGSVNLAGSVQSLDAPSSVVSSHGDSVGRIEASASRPEVPPISAGPSVEIETFMETISVITKQRAVIQTLSEKGSPSDEDLAKLEGEKKKMGELKRSSAAKLNSFSTAGVVLPAQLETAWDFIESLVKDTDLPPGNVELLGAILSHIATDYAALIEERGLAAIAACDSSITYLRQLLQVPNIRLDVVDLISSCFFNQTARIPLTLCVLQQPKSVVDIEPVADDLSLMWQEFFEDVASKKRAIPREDRSGRIELLKVMLETESVPLDVEAEGSDGQNIIFRAAVDGDKELVDLILSHKPLSDINAKKTGDMTVFHAAIVGNDVAIVKALLSKYPEIDVNATCESGTAMDLAVNLGRDAAIVSILKEKGVKAVGKKTAPRAGAKKSTGKKAPAKVGLKSKSPAPKRR